MTQRLMVSLAATAFLLSATTYVRAQYIITDLGSLEGYGTSPTATNAPGQAVGKSSSTKGEHASVYINGTTTDVTPPGVRPSGSTKTDVSPPGIQSSGSQAAGINSSSQAPGNASVGGVAGGARPYVKDEGKATKPGSSGSNRTEAPGVNDRGQGAGSANKKSGSGFAVLYDASKLVTPDTVPGSPTGSPAGISNAGQVMGNLSATVNGATSTGFVSSDGKITAGGTLGGARASEAASINNPGPVTGYASTPDNAAHGLLFGTAKMTDLSPVQDNSRGIGGINNASQAVGTLAPGGNLRPWGTLDPSYGLPQPASRAFLFGNGKVGDLNDLIPANSDWVLNNTTGMNNLGQVIGDGTRPGAASHAFLLPSTAVAPEPGSLALLGLGAAGLAGHVWRKRRRAAVR